MSALSPIALSTGALFAHLSWKQADIIIALDPDFDGDDQPYLERRWRTTRQVSEFLQEIRDMDLHEGMVRYWGVDYGGTYSTLTGMLRRGVLKRDYAGRWGLTDLGRQISKEYL